MLQSSEQVVMKSLPREIVEQIARTPADGSNMPIARLWLLWMATHHERVKKLPARWRESTTKAWWVCANLPTPAGKSEANTVQIAFLVVGFDLSKCLAAAPSKVSVNFACLWDGVMKPERGWDCRDYSDQILATEQYEAEEQKTYADPDNGKPDKPKGRKS